MSEPITVKVSDGVSPLLRQLGFYDIKRDIQPAMKPLEAVVETAVRSAIAAKDPYGGSLSRLAIKGVKSKPFSYGVGFTTYVDSRMWLHIFENGTYKSPNRNNDGKNRGGITALSFLELAEDNIEPTVVARLRSAVEQAVNQKFR